MELCTSRTWKNSRDNSKTGNRTVKELTIGQMGMFTGTVLNLITIRNKNLQQLKICNQKSATIPRKVRVWFKCPAGLGYGKKVG